MTIRFKKGSGGPDTLTCVRDDGSSTWSALNYTVHDFGHYAVETSLGFREAFFGLLARGWDVADFGTPAPNTGRKPSVPLEAMQAEALAGLLDIERRTQRPPEHGDFMDMLDSVCVGLGVARPGVSPQSLAAIRRCEAGLLLRWRQIAPGAVMELEF